MAKQTSSQKPTKVTGELMFRFVKTIIDEGLEEQFLQKCADDKFYLNGSRRCMKIAADFLAANEPEPVAAAPGGAMHLLALTPAAPQSLKARVCSQATCEFE